MTNPAPSYNSGSKLVHITTWLNYIFGYLLVVLVIVDWIWDHHPEATWRWLTGLTGIIIILLTFWWRKDMAWLSAVLLIILLGLGGFLTFWTIIGGILAAVCMVLVAVSTIQSAPASS